MSSRHLLVTGGCGFVGSALVRQLIARDYRVTVLDALTYSGRVDNLDAVAADRRLEIVVGDIADAHLLQALFNNHRFSGLINLAAETHVDRSISDARAFITTNVQGTQNLLDEARRYWQALDGEREEGFRFVQVSTDEVFGSLGSEGYFSETSPYAPRSPYAASKAAADHLVAAAFYTHGLPVITTYCGNNYGPRQYPEKFIPLTIKNALAGEIIPVYGDGKNVRDWVHVEDHADGLIAALERGVPGSRYCLGSRNELTNLEVLDLVCAALEVIRPSSSGKKYRDLATFVVDRLGHDRRYALDATKAKEELRFMPRHTLQTSIAEVVRSYIESAS
jgi:dTDP-glucose 4,6-dehydratase